MQESTIYIKQIMDTYYKVTKNGSLCFDTRLNLVSALPETISLHEFSCLGLDRLLSFLAENFSLSSNDEQYFAYFLHSNLICHVIFLVKNGNYIGAIITEPVLVKPMTDKELEAFNSLLNLPYSGRGELHKILLKKKIIPYDKAMALGTVLYSLCQGYLKISIGSQILKSLNDTVSGTDKVVVGGSKEWNTKGMERHVSSTVYMRIRRAIQEGDINAIMHILDKQSAANAPMYQLHKTDHVRSIKNSFIKLCSMACYAAIDAGAPYVQTLDIADDMVLKMESLENIAEIYEMMRSVLLEFTKAVANGKKVGYSKPVRKIMDYLYIHYNEKVTLEDLSALTRFSTYYISNLIKAETGLSLNDNLNKIRIEQSQKFLLEKNASILEIAQNVGFHYQNHFAAVFKKYTGVSPTEYRNIQGMEQMATQLQETAGGESISLAIGQLKTKLNIFTGFYDMVRVVDPLEHNSWVIYGEELLDKDNHLTCYSFWNRNESCQNCISMRAYVQNDTFFKLEKKEESTFLVLAFPQYIAKSIYIAEIVKDISKQSVISIKNKEIACEAGDSNKEEKTGLYTRYYVDKQLPKELRRFKLEQNPITLVIAAFSPAEKLTTSDNLNLLFAEAALSSLPHKEDWVGHYTGNLFLFVLHHCTEEQAREIFERVQDNFKEKLEDSDAKAISLQFAEQELSAGITEVGELFYLLFAKLHRKVQPDT